MTVQFYVTIIIQCRMILFQWNSCMKLINIATRRLRSRRHFQSVPLYCQFHFTYIHCVKNGIITNPICTCMPVRLPHADHIRIIWSHHHKNVAPFLHGVHGVRAIHTGPHDKQAKWDTTGKLVLLIVAAVCLFGLFTWCQVLAFNKRLKLTDNVFDVEIDMYIYAREEPETLDYQELVTKNKKRSLKLKVQKAISKLRPHGKSSTDDPWVMLRLAQSKNHVYRKVALEKIVKAKWEDYHYTYIAQSINRATIVGLARMSGASDKLFRQMPKLSIQKLVIEDEFREILSALPQDGVDRCISYFTAKALLEGRVDEESASLACFGYTGVDFAKSISPRPEGAIEIQCLEALVSHSMIAAHCVTMVDLGVLLLLHRVFVKFSDSVIIQRFTAWILGNMALNTDLHRAIIDGGWVTALHHWVQSGDLALSLFSGRALANLDRDTKLGGGINAVYEDGIYLVHPLHRPEEKIHADVVFVHGLMGGPFKTWRQKDPRHQPGFIVDDDVRKNYTFCWPKDWLAKDCRNLRILNVGYDSELSQWNAKCPFEYEKRTLAKRGAELIEKLRRADIGSRPIIWVGHSMGGLLIKQMLQTADSDWRYRNMMQNTMGVMFYSTPHHGSSLAKYSNQAHYLIYPSVEVKELDKDNKFLQTLHKSFLQIMSQNDIDCTSFGENKKTAIGLNLKTFIVPPESSDPGIGKFHSIDEDHLNICKPETPDSDIYKLSQMFVHKCLVKRRLQGH